MASEKVLLEITQKLDSGFGRMTAALASESESLGQAEALVADLAGFGIEIEPGLPPVPMFGVRDIERAEAASAAFSSAQVGMDLDAPSTVIACEVDRSKLDELRSRDGVRVWPNPELELVGRPCRCGREAEPEEGAKPEVPSAAAPHLFDLARSAGGMECAPFRPGVAIDVIRSLLGVEAVWRDGFRGQNIVVGVVDEGVNRFYPVIGGLNLAGAFPPGGAPITSHGSMCAADVLVAAPFAKLYDYPMLKSTDAMAMITMLNAVLEQRRRDGTPQVTTNSYAFYSRPPRNVQPNHPAWDPNHPSNRKVAEVVASGCPCFFAAGNCGADCPDGRCRVGSIGPNASISGPNSLPGVITIAAVNSRHERVGYSSQGPGGFEHFKPDLSAYTHFFGNFGPGRPGGVVPGIQFDAGTSAATPVAAGVAALLLSVQPRMTPTQLKAILIQGSINVGPPGWDRDTGFGVINAAASYFLLTRGLAPSSFGAATAATTLELSSVPSESGFVESEVGESWPSATAPQSTTRKRKK